MNGNPNSRAKYASLTAVEPLDASTTVVSLSIQPLHSAYRNSDLASRCFSEPVGCTDSSLRYRSTQADGGIGKTCRWVSALRFASASTLRIASATQARAAASDRSVSLHRSTSLTGPD